jgi:hypothetical protein
MSNSGQAHRSRLRQRLHTRRHVHAIAEQIAGPHRRLANMQPDPEGNSMLLRNFLVHGGYSLLNTERTLQRIDGA